MSDVRGRELRPRVTRKPSPGLAARMKLLEQDAEKRRNGTITGDAAAAAKMEIARSGAKNKDGFSNDEGEGGSAKGNALNGCSSGGAITNIIHTYNSQPAALTATHLVAQPATNGAAKTRISDRKLVPIATEEDPSKHVASSPAQLNKHYPHTHSLNSPSALPILELPRSDNDGSDGEVEETYIAEPTCVTDEHDLRGETQTLDPELIQQQEDNLNQQPEESQSKEPQPEDLQSGEPHFEEPHLEEPQPEEPQPEVPQSEEPQSEPIQSEDQGGVIEDQVGLEQESIEEKLHETDQHAAITHGHIPELRLPEDDTVPGGQEMENEMQSDNQEGDVVAQVTSTTDAGDGQGDTMVAPERPVTPEPPEAHQPETSNSTETPSAAPPFDPTPFTSGTGLQRRSSVYSLSRISFSAQLSRLTSLALPLSSEFSERIKKMETSVEVSGAITASARQILRWIDTAKTVLKGLDSEDDVEWAAQGKKSLVEVDIAVGKFSNLMKVYVAAIDELQERADAPSIGADIFKDVVKTMEIILDGWNEVQDLLKGVKEQVETAMEWKELWTTILQDIQAEIEACQTIVFEIEEKRHRALMEEGGTNAGMDIDTLATIVEDPREKMNVQASEEDSSLLKLFARMQPLRASLDFLPMRISSFQGRAEGIFPSACEDLELRRKSLEQNWRKLNTDAEEMRRELGEDKWVAIFRNAGKQATHMIDSVERSLKKLKDAVNHFHEGADMSADSGINKKVEAYEAKRVHYGMRSLITFLFLANSYSSFYITGPAIQRVLAIIDKGVADRLTVNGEILRLHAAMHKRWKHIEQEMATTDEVLTELNLHASQQALRDSVSTIMSMDARSPNSMMQTPGSSPASSIVLSSPAHTAKSGVTVQRRSESAAGQYAKVSRGALGPNSATGGTARPKLSGGRAASNSFNHHILSPTSSRGPSPSPHSPRISVYHTPRRSSAASARSTSSLDNRPKWNISVNTNGLDTGHNFKPLSLTTPSEHRGTSRSNTPGIQTRIPLPSPCPPRYGPNPGQNSSLNPVLHSPTYKYSGITGSKRASIYGASGFFRSPYGSPRSVSGTSSQGGLDIPHRPELRSQQSMTNLSGMYHNSARRPSINSHLGDDQVSNATTSAVRHVRPASAMAGGKRSSMIPRPRSPSVQSASGAANTTNGDSMSGIASGRASRAKRMSMPSKSYQAQDSKPKWK